MRRHDETIDRLGSLPLFATCNRSELKLMARTMTMLREHP